MTADRPVSTPVVSHHKNTKWKTIKRNLPWLLVVLPAIFHMVLVCYCVVNRIAYPFDLEWMEGGMLEHAARIGDKGLYVPPSVHFVPYPYPPLYPLAVAGLGVVLGIDYPVARGVSVVAVMAVSLAIAWAVSSSGRTDDNFPRAWSRASALLAVGIFAAAYPWVEGWYDIARVDSMFLALVVGGLVGLTRCCTRPQGSRFCVSACALLLALAFFCKQTGIFFVFAGAVVLLCRQPRQFITFSIVAGGISLLGTVALDHITDGWYRTYVFEVLASHDFSWRRFFASFGHIFGHFPIATAVVVTSLLFVLITRSRNSALLTWIWFTAIAAVAGAAGWAKSWAHFNAYIPAVACLAVTAGIGALSIVATATRHFHERRHLPAIAAWITMASIAVQLLAVRWQPTHFTPTPHDTAAGMQLIEEIRAIDGEVLVPFHPWYARLAGKKTYLHRMPALDVSYGRGLPIHGLREALHGGAFAAILWDNRPIDAVFSTMKSSYPLATPIPESARPRVYTGAGSPAEVKGDSNRLLRPHRILRPTAR